MSILARRSRAHFATTTSWPRGIRPLEPFNLRPCAFPFSWGCATFVSRDHTAVDSFDVRCGSAGAVTVECVVLAIFSPHVCFCFASLVLLVFSFLLSCFTTTVSPSLIPLDEVRGMSRDIRLPRHTSIQPVARDDLHTADEISKYSACGNYSLLSSVSLPRTVPLKKPC
jgi:hypothetical protein